MDLTPGLLSQGWIFQSLATRSALPSCGFLSYPSYWAWLATKSQSCLKRWKISLRKRRKCAFLCCVHRKWNDFLCRFCDKKHPNPEIWMRGIFEFRMDFEIMGSWIYNSIYRWVVWFQSPGCHSWWCSWSETTSASLPGWRGRIFVSKMEPIHECPMASHYLMMIQRQTFPSWVPNLDTEKDQKKTKPASGSRAPKGKSSSNHWFSRAKILVSLRVVLSRPKLLQATKSRTCRLLHREENSKDRGFLDTKAGWWFQIFFFFTPKIGEDEPI